MSLLDDYEELCNAQDKGIFKEVLDETLKPILISLEEKFYQMSVDVIGWEMKLDELKDNLQKQIEELKLKQESDIIETND